MQWDHQTQQLVGEHGRLPVGFPLSLMDVTSPTVKLIAPKKSLPSGGGYYWILFDGVSRTTLPNRLDIQLPFDQLEQPVLLAVAGMSLGSGQHGVVV